jgi:hypothetical protein
VVVVVGPVVFGPGPVVGSFVGVSRLLFNKHLSVFKLIDRLGSWGITPARSSWSGRALSDISDRRLH